ncbi:MAG TPA: DUF2802 domain-containing protein [Steroidobacteraceae bacterium]|jgi:hypothetical protein
MFEILPNPSFETIMMVGRAALLLGAFWVFALAFSRWRRSDERQMQQLRGELQRTFAEVRSLHETLAVMNARMESLSERAESDARFAPAGAAGSQRGYDLAARLAKNGAGVDELVSSCGITRHEAELLSRLHVSKPRAKFEAPTPTPQPAAGGRKRGSLLSVVG